MASGLNLDLSKPNRTWLPIFLVKSCTLPGVITVRVSALLARVVTVGMAMIDRARPLFENFIFAAARRADFRVRGQGLPATPWRIALDEPMQAFLVVRDAAGAARLYMIGPDELARSEVTVRDLVTGEQTTEPIPA